MSTETLIRHIEAWRAALDTVQQPDAVHGDRLVERYAYLCGRADVLFEQVLVLLAKADGRS